MKLKPSSVEAMEFQLGLLANEWRKEHSQGHYDQAELVVKSYQEIMEKLWTLGWDGEGLLPDSELPRALMPPYFNRKWGR